MNGNARDETVAVMQPYFYPYAGYFRLMAAAATFVILDDVQFARRGRVHRCALNADDRAVKWLTLPLARAPQATRICDLVFAEHARATLDERLRAVPGFMPSASDGAAAARVRAHLTGRLTTPLRLLEDGLALIADVLDLPIRFVRSSEVAIDPALRGAARIVALVQALEGISYVNAPGGRALYDAADFSERGITLRFLESYDGAYRCMLPALLTQEPPAIRADVLRTTRFFS